MALQTTVNINIDFYDKKYILINAKQLDRKSRFISITCYNHGELYPINEGEHSAYIRYRKADNNSVFNFCEIDRKGKIIVELTEQMLAVDGICCADLVIVNEGGAKVDSQTGEIISIENSSILSTMPLHIDVTGNAVENSDIESSYEFNGLNTALEKVEAEYEEVMKTSKSWAVGGTGIRSGENTDNAKYYSKQSSNSASAANASALNAAESERIAGEHKDTAIVHSGKAYSYMTSAESAMNSAIESRDSAANSASAAKTSEANAKISETNAQTYMDEAYVSELNAKASESNAKSSEEKSLISEQNAKASEINVLASEQNVKTSETNAYVSEQNAKAAQSAAENAENNAKQAASQAAKEAAELAAQNAVDNVSVLMNDCVTASQDAAKSAKNSKELASISEQNAKTSEANALISEQNAKGSETSAKTYMDNAKVSENNASNSFNKAQSYAVGGTGTRDDEDSDNARYYYELIKNIIVGLDTGFIPKGTVSFDELSSSEKIVGYVYNMRDDFITDNTFREGEGKSYTAGTNVYCTADGWWDCLGGSASPTASVSEVKDYLGI